MGMSSSQARLLSLTARQHSLELRAQRLQADKLIMANESDKVQNDYLEALDATKTNALITMEDGTIGDTLLTAEKVYDYRALAKQYALKTNDGRTLISESLHNNYKTTNSLSDFLNLYGLKSNYTQTVHHKEPNPAYDNAYDRWEADHDKWEQEVIDYNKEMQDYYNKLDDYHNNLYPNWETKEPDKNDPQYTTTTDNLADKFMAAGGNCYKDLVDMDDVGCYAHILGHLIDYVDGKGYSSADNGGVAAYYNGKTYTTSTGKTFNNTDYNMGYVNSDAEAKKTFAEVSAKIDDEKTYKAAVAAGETPDVTAASSEADKLKSKFNVDGSVKSIKQWAMDLYYLCKNYTTIGGITKAEVADTVIDFQNGIAGSLNFDEAKYNADREQWIKDEPKPPPVPKPPRKEPLLSDYVNGIPQYNEHDTTVDHTTFANKDMAQWYINLWHKMEGLDDVPKIKEEIVHDDKTGKDVSIYSIDNVAKSNTTYGTDQHSGAVANDNYIVVSDDLLDKSDWVNTCIKEGWILVQVFDTFENKFIDTSPAVDSRLETVPDTQWIKKAEATYEADMKKINAKETKIDTELQEIEADRTAVKTEQDDLKQIIKDNVDLSFKLFS